MTHDEDGFVLGAASRSRRRSAARRPARRAIRRAPITVIIPFAGGSASDVVSRIMFDKMSKIDGPADHRREPARRRRQFRHAQAARKAAPDGYTLVGGGSGPVAANLALYKTLGYDPEKDLEMISPFAGFTIVVVASKKLPVQVAQGADRPRQGQSRQAQLRIGRHRQLAASGRRIFQPGHRREDDPRALSQHRAVRSRPDRRHGASSASSGIPNVAGPISAKGAIPLAVAGDKRLAGAARHADHHRSRPAAIQGQRLVRAARAGRHAEADPGAAQQGS